DSDAILPGDNDVILPGDSDVILPLSGKRKRTSVNTVCETASMENIPIMDKPVADVLSEVHESSTEYYLRNVTVDCYSDNNGKRVYAKSVYCMFCKNALQSKLKPHLEACHSDEKEVKEFRCLPLHSVERKMALKKILNEGNFLHNCEVLKAGKGTMIVSRRPNVKTGKVDASKFLPCEYCLAFLEEKWLWLHAKSCYFRPGNVVTEKNYKRNSKMIIEPFILRSHEEEEEIDSLISKMKETEQNPGLKDICFQDVLIREFGLSLLHKLGTSEEQRVKDKDNVRTKMRCVVLR
ncbi:uncharacterized protein LOC128551503, partial [Mercenaria mercenaria]|uniref:uncharacterized protein LOC128551503 n=1 Tax=Mercenaria mercenaria TaxID=6596 RepID=UPI00234F749A